jgi:hypothetical protein
LKKNHKFDIKDKIKNYKTLDKIANKNNNKSKAGPDKKTSYVQIIIKLKKN